MNQLMNSIDAIKQKITDAEYKQLCDQMMELNTQRKTTEKFYRVWYVNVKTTVLDEDDDHTTATTKFFPEILNKIFKLRAETVEMIRSNLDKLGYSYVDKKLLEYRKFGSESQASLPVITCDGVYYIDPKIAETLITRIEDME